MPALLKKILFVTFMIIGSLTAVASPYKIEDNTIDNFEVPVFSSKSVGICFWDQRQQVTDKSRPLSFMGYLRGGYGNVFGVVLESGNPFYSLLNDRLQKALSKNNADVKIASVSPFDDEQTAKQSLMATRCDRLILIKMNKMMVDGYGKNYKYSINLEVIVLNQKGEVLSSKFYSGESDLGKPQKYKNLLPESIKKGIFNALNQTEIITACNSKVESSDVGNINPVPANAGEPKKFDLLVTKKGDEIECMVTEITETVIKYKNKNQPDGPVRNINISEVFMIKYKDGTKELMKQ